MSSVATIKKPTLKSLAAEMRRLQERIEDIEDLIELRSAIERNAGKPGVPWERGSKNRGGPWPNVVLRIARFPQAAKAE